MPLRETYGARRYNERITLTRARTVTDEYGHQSLSAPVDVMEVYAYVRQMSAQKTMMTFQQADVVGLDIELRTPGVAFNGIRYRGFDVHFSEPDNNGRILHIAGYYQQDNPDAFRDFDASHGEDYF